VTTLQKTISIPHHGELEGKLLWTVSTPEIGQEIYKVLQQQRQRQRDFSSDYLDPNCPTGGLFSGRSERTTVALGTKYRFEGFVSFYTRDATADIGSASRLEGLNGGDVKDIAGKVVTADCLRNYPGYENYSGKGAVCWIEVVEAFYKRQGVGTLALRHLQEQCDFELIELEATGAQQWQVSFYEKLGFVDANIDLDEGNRIAMAWHNPKYRAS
jgi:GNAT superfamily N-acetyltransferase